MGVEVSPTACRGNLQYHFCSNRAPGAQIFRLASNLLGALLERGSKKIVFGSNPAILTCKKLF